MTPNIRVVRDWIVNGWSVKEIQVTNCRPIAGSVTYSQHSWSNALDVFVTPAMGDDLAAALAQRFGDDIYELLWRVDGHFDHIHVSTYPKGWLTPPCAGGVQRIKYENGVVTNGPFPLTIDQGDIEDMSVIARCLVVEAGSKGWLPTQEAIDYWLIRADNLSNPAYATEWRTHFEPMWAIETQNEYKKMNDGLVLPKPVASSGVTLAQVKAEINKAKVVAST